MLKNAVTVFPRPTRGIVHHIHTNSSVYIGEQSTSDEAVTQRRHDVHTLNIKILKRFSMFWSAAAVCPHCVLTARIWRDVSRIIWSCRCTCLITLDRFRNTSSTHSTLQQMVAVDQGKTSQHGLEDPSLFKAPTLLMHQEMGQVRAARLRFQAPTLLAHTEE